MYLIVYEIDEYPEMGGGTYVEEKETLEDVKTFVEDNIERTDTFSIYGVDDKYKVVPKEVVKTIDVVLDEGE